MSRPSALTIAIGDQIVAMLREAGSLLSTAEIRARIGEGPGAPQRPAEHCPSCTCTETVVEGWSRERYDLQVRVYPVLCRLERKGAVEGMRKGRSGEVYWRLIEADEVAALGAMYVEEPG